VGCVIDEASQSRDRGIEAGPLSRVEQVQQSLHRGCSPDPPVLDERSPLGRQLDTDRTAIGGIPVAYDEAGALQAQIAENATAITIVVGV